MMSIGKRRYIIDMATQIDDSNNAKKTKVETKIIHLNDDCLEKLFLYLSLKDLGSVAMSNTRFTNSANYVFQKIHNETIITFDPFATNANIYNGFLNILEGFGENIRKLNVRFFSERRYRTRNQKMINIINEKCSKSVIELTLAEVQKDMIISTPFLHLRRLMIVDSFLNGSMINLIQNSPNISSLQFYAVENVFDSAFVEQHIPMLEHFANYNQVIMDDELENLQKFRQFVNANQQLTSVGIGARELEMMIRYEDVRQQFFKTIHRKLPFPDRKDYIEYLLPFESVYFRNLKSLSLGLCYGTDFLRCMRERRLIIGNLPLEQLELHIGDFTIQTVDFLIQCRHLQKLQLYVFESLDFMSTAAAALNLPELLELELFLLYNEDLETTVIPSVMGVIIKNCQRLKRVVVSFEIRQDNHVCNSSSNYEEKTAKHFEPVLVNSFTEHLSSDWQVHCKAQNIEVMRRHARNVFVLSAILDNQSKVE